MTSQIPTQTLDKIEELVQQRAGLRLSASLLDTRRSSILRAFQRSGTANLEQYVEQLYERQELFDDLLDEMTIGETYFFRTPAHFELLESIILPELNDRLGSDHVLRFWSAGCATGEEPYSLSMLVEQLGLSDRTRILATDVSRRALTMAHRAVYSEWSLRDQGYRALMYLNRIGASYQLQPRLRNSVHFEYLNLASDAYPSVPRGLWGMDVIFCRNVLIYFDRPTIRQVAQRLHATLAEGGWLVTGASDPALQDYAEFDTVATEAGVFYRRKLPAREPVKLPVPQTSAVVPQVGPLATYTARESRPAPARRSSAAAPPATGRRDVRWEPPEVIAELARELTTRGRTAEGLALIGDALVRYPLEAELYYWNAVLLMDRGAMGEAILRLKQAIYLDRHLIAAHFLLGLVLQHTGDLAGARRAFTNVQQQCTGLPGDDVVPLTDGQKVSGLAEIAAAHAELLRTRIQP